MTFVIDADNNITAYANAAAPGSAELKLSEHRFGSEKELATLAATWPGARLVEIWNTLPGATPVKKFTDRKKAVARIWKAIQRLVPNPAAAPASTSATAKPRKGKRATASDKPATARDGSKKALVLELLKRCARIPERHARQEDGSHGRVRQA